VERPNSDPTHGGSRSSFDEFDLIERLRIGFEAAAGTGPPAGEIWIGDDAAVVQLGEERVVLTTDLVVEGVHFDRALAGPSDVGYKALMVTLSDLAAMGARPRDAVVSVAAPPGSELEAVGAGVADAARETGCRIVGGDLSACPVLVVSVAAVGTLEGAPGRPALLRSGATPGDTLFVTGPLGGAAAGLRVLGESAGSSDGPGGPADETSDLGLGLVARFLRPRARVAEGEVARRSGSSAAVDVSDGLVADVDHLGEASGVGIALDEVPVERGASLEEALHGGEDYELVVATGNPAGLVAAFDAAGLAVPLRIGTCTARRGVPTLAGEPIGPGGWRHTF
jgi:thiamine-monophosphate kinase